MQFDLVSRPDIGMLPCAAVFDFDTVSPNCKDSADVMKRYDEPALARSIIAYDADEQLVKFRFYINEVPPNELVAKATSTLRDAHFKMSGGTLCAAWEEHFNKSEFWMSEIAQEKRKEFSGQFKDLASGNYRVAMYGLLKPVPPPPPEQPDRFYDPILALGAIVLFILLPASLYLMPVAALAGAFFWSWYYLLLLVPPAVVLAWVKIGMDRAPKMWKQMATEYMLQDPDVLVVLTPMNASEVVNTMPLAYLVRPGMELDIRQRQAWRERTSFI